MEDVEIEGFRKDLLIPGSFDAVVSNMALVRAPPTFCVCVVKAVQR